MASYSHILLTLCVLFIISFASSSSSNPSTSTLSLYKPLSPYTFQALVSSSITRAHHLKQHKSYVTSSNVTTPIYSKSYGGYSINLRFGTPPQTLPFILDTGSSLVWFPCSSHYLCSRCSFSNTNPKNIPTFNPKNSSSAKFVVCRDPKCGWIHVQSQCLGCEHCTLNCPPYMIQYGSGSTAGRLLSETLTLSGITVPDFMVGCSILSTRQPSGIAGFGRGRESLPSQMGLKRFSYCLLSHKFDDMPENSDLILHFDDTNVSDITYTSFHVNPSESSPAFQEYYYLTLRKIIVGGEWVRVPLGYLEPDCYGNGGTIVDSGSTFTFMERLVFELVVREFEKQMVNFTRVRDVEDEYGLSPCFDFSGNKMASVPDLTLEFEGGANMTLPVENYFSSMGDSGAACLTIVSDDDSGLGRGDGPAIILGNSQFQNFYVEYDLENQRFGFRPQSCQMSA